MAHYRTKKYIWAFPTLAIIVALFIVFKPTNTSSKQNLNAQQEHTALQTIRIAVPDMSSSSRPSGGTALIDNIYLNDLLQKELAEKHIKVEWQFFKGAGPAINEALANKQIDFAFLGDFAMIIGKSKGIDTTLLMATGRNVPCYLAVLPNKGYNSLAALKGKKIGVFQGTAMQLSFTQFIHQQGYSEKDFRIVNMDPAAINAALAASQIDAGWGMVSNLVLKEKGLVEIPLSTRKSNGVGTIQAGLLGRTEFITAHPELTQKLVNVVLQSANWAAQPSNFDAAINLVTENAGVPKALYRLNLDGQNLKDVYSPQLDRAYLDHLQSGVTAAFNAKLIKNNFKVDQWVDPSFVEQGIKQLEYNKTWVSK